MSKPQKLIMYLFLLIVFIISCFLLSGCRNNSTEETMQTIDIASLSTDENRMFSMVEIISKTPRVIGSDNEKRTYKFLKEELDSYGYEVKTQEFPYKILNSEDFMIEDKNSIYTDFSNKKPDGISQNLIAVKKTDQENTKENDIIILSAYYDTINDCYGAIDNASGVSILMEVARVLAPVSNNSNKEIHFILFSGSKNNLFGSHYYVHTLSEHDKKHISAVINLDKIGEEGPIEPILGTHDVKENYATELFSDYNLEIKKGPSSDHLAFHYADIPALTITQYRSEMLRTVDDIRENDNAERIDKMKLKQLADMLLSVLLEECQGDGRLCEN